MSSDYFSPMSLNTLAAASSASTYAAKAGGSLSVDELESMGIEVHQPGEDDMGLDFTDFLQLMVQQLQNQTVDNTTDTSDMLNQLVQMSVVQMMSQVQDSLQSLVDANTLTYAASLVGKEVTVGRYDEKGNLEEIVGQVTGTGTYQGSPVIFVDGEMYSLNSIMAVGRLPEIPEEPETPEAGGDSTQKPETPDTGEEVRSVG